MTIRPSVGNLDSLVGRDIVIVDIDGTVVDSSERAKSFSHLDRDKLGIYPEAVRKKMYADILKDPVFPCVGDYLHALQGQGIKIVYLTARDDLALALTLRHFRENHIPVDAVFFEPEEYLGRAATWKRDALSELKESCKIIHYFEDHLPHVEDARRLGIPVTQVTNPETYWCDLLTK